MDPTFKDTYRITVSNISLLIMLRKRFAVYSEKQMKPVHGIHSYHYPIKSCYSTFCAIKVN